MNGQNHRVAIKLGEMPSTGNELLNDVRSFIQRFCCFPDEHCLDAVTLWAAHAHMVLEFHTTPRLALLSPEPSSGKSRVLDILDVLVPESLYTVNPSPATIFRSLAQEQLTLLFDEVDAIWRKSGKDDKHEDLRALLNSGYRRGATVPRCVGPKHDVMKFDVFCAVAMAGLGSLPDTLMARSVIIKMRPRAPYEEIESFHFRRHESEGTALKQRLAEWAGDVGKGAGEAWPDLPKGIQDRPAEIWEPLIAVADVAGGDWPEKSRKACVALCRDAEDRGVSLGLRLLSDIRILFGDADAMHSQTIIDQLTTDQDQEEPRLDADAPWADLWGKPLGKRGLASKLKKYDVRPQKVSVDGISLQGYRREHLWDAWERYLPPLGTGKPEHPESPEPQDTDIPDMPDNRTPERAVLTQAGQDIPF